MSITSAPTAISPDTRALTSVATTADVPMSVWLQGLNERQIQAVTHRGSALLVVAGAGTGKTRTLASRTASLLAQGVRPERILLLTFTRRAAAEMLARTRAMTPQLQGNGKVHGGTFHAVANQLLRQHARQLGLHDGFTVMDQADAVDVIAMARREVVADVTAGSRFPKASTLSSIMSRVANAQEPLSVVLRDRFPWCADHADAIREVFGTYAARKRSDNIVDFDDLLLFWRALMADPHIGDRLRGQYDHVLVDEYQDVNAIQADIVHALGTPGRSGQAATVTAVGDDAQAIYAFRASSPDHLLDFTERHVGAELITLDRSYRCTPAILDIANAVQGAAAKGHPKTLWTTREGGAQPRLVTTYDEAEQSTLVTDTILGARERGIGLRDQAVLYRTGTHANALELELTRRNIPYVKFGGLKFLERAHVKDLHAMLRLLENPGDRLGWHRLLRLAEGVGASWERKMLTQLGVGAWRPEDGFDRSPVARLVDAPLTSPAAAQPFLAAVQEAWRTCIGQDQRQPPPGVQVEALRRVCEIAWPPRYLDHEARLADVDRLAIAASANASRGAFLSQLTLDPPTSTGDLAGEPHLDDDWLTLSTIHSAKGLEWRAVHVIHAADGNLPSDMALRDKDGIEEERRLAYVAITRARDELHVTVPLRYHKADNGLSDQHGLAQLSRFLQPVRHLFIQESPSTADVAGSPAAGGAVTAVHDRLASLWAG